MQLRDIASPNHSRCTPNSAFWVEQSSAVIGRRNVTQLHTSHKIWVSGFTLFSYSSCLTLEPRVDTNMRFQELNQLFFKSWIKCYYYYYYTAKWFLFVSLLCIFFFNLLFHKYMVLALCRGINPLFGMHSNTIVNPPIWCSVNFFLNAFQAAVHSTVIGASTIHYKNMHPKEDTTQQRKSMHHTHNVV
jgi:hypothetical protein